LPPASADVFSPSSATPFARACWFLSAVEYALRSDIDTPQSPLRIRSAILPWIQPKSCAALFFAQRLMRPMMRPQKPRHSGSGRSTAAFWPAVPFASPCFDSPSPPLVSLAPAAFWFSCAAPPAAFASAAFFVASSFRAAAYSSYLP
jgi:hypothetical protein